MISNIRLCKFIPLLLPLVPTYAVSSAIRNSLYNFYLRSALFFLHSWWLRLVNIRQENCRQLGVQGIPDLVEGSCEPASLPYYFNNSTWHDPWCISIGVTNDVACWSWRCCESWLELPSFAASCLIRKRSVKKLCLMIKSNEKLICPRIRELFGIDRRAKFAEIFIFLVTFFTYIEIV